MSKVCVTMLCLIVSAFAGVKADSWFEENNIPQKEIKAYNDTEYKKQIEISRKDLYLLDGENNSDVASILISASSEQCIISMDSAGEVVDSNCLKLVDSKKKVVYCTANKQMCKAIKSIREFVFGTTEKKSQANSLDSIPVSKRDVALESCKDASKRFYDLQQKMFIQMTNSEKHLTPQQRDELQVNLMHRVAQSCIEGCKKNNAAYCVELSGILSLMNHHEESLLLLSKACDLKSVQGCFYMAHDLHLRRQYKLALQYYTKSCDLGGMAACSNMGILYERGLGVRQDDKKALHYFGKACDAGIQQGCNGYARIKKRYR